MEGRRTRRRSDMPYYTPMDRAWESMVTADEALRKSMERMRLLQEQRACQYCGEKGNTEYFGGVPLCPECSKDIPRAR